MDDGDVTSAAPELVNLVTSLTKSDSDEARRVLVTEHVGEAENALEILTNLVRQAPATHAERSRVLALLPTTSGALHPGQVLAAGHMLRTRAPRFPDAGVVLAMPALDPALTGALQAVLALDRSVHDPWTLVGGLMVMLHCVEHQVQFARATADADVAVGVFTHREALLRVTQGLDQLGFADITPTTIGQ